MEDLAKSEIKYRSIFENSGVGMLYVDENMTITLANKEFERITGYSREQVEGIMSWTVLVSDKDDLDRMKTYHRLRRVDPALAPESYNTRMCTRSGAVRDVSLHVIMIPGMTDSLVAFTDITEQHLAENALIEANRMLKVTITRLEESEEQVRGITANLPGVVYQLYAWDNGEYEISYTSERVTEVFGMPAGPDNTFRTFVEHVHSEDRERFLASIKKAIETCTTWNFEGRFIKPSGEVIWFNGISSPARHEDRTVFNGILFDITGRKHAEDALKKSENKLAIIYENTPNAITISDIKTGIVIDANRGIEWTGWTPEEVIGKTPEMLHNWISPDTGEKIRKIIESEKKLTNQHVEFYKKDGTIAQALMSSVFIEMDNKPCLLTISTDITRLMETEEKFLKIFMTTPDCIVISRIRDGRVIDVNRGFEEISGWKRDEVLGKNTVDLHVWADSADRDRMVKDLQSGHDILNRETLVRRKDGTILNVVYSARPIQIDGESCLIFVLQDITEYRKLEEERRKLEQQLLQSQKLDAIGTLAGGIAHDFNNILSGILGYTELSMLALHDSGKLEKYLTEVMNATGRARDLVNQILAFSRHSETELRTITPSYVIREALKLLRASIPATIELRTDINSTSAILGDPTLLHQVVVNLCSNAAYSMKDSKGVVEINMEDADLDEETARLHHGLHPGKHVLLTISDTGCGIDPDLVDRIFEPFFTTKPRGEGTGLGLSVVHGIIKKFNGIITVYTEPGKGTVINIYIPVISADGIKINPEQAADLTGGNERIILLDDELPIIDSMRTTLMNLGYTVDAFTDSTSALAAFRDNPVKYDLLITDYTMPHLTGIDIAGIIKQIRHDIPVILCSGFVHKTVEEDARGAGISELLKKPVGRSDIAGAIRRVLDKKQDRFL